MAPKGKAVPEGDFLNAVKRDFGSMEKLEAAFTNTAGRGSCMTPRATR